MIVLGYNGFTHSRDIRISDHGTQDIDRYNVLGHDAAAAVIFDGKVVAAVEEERLNREKKTSQFPVGAIEWCLAKAGIGLADVDYFAFPWAVTDEVIRSLVLDIFTMSPNPTIGFALTAEIGELYSKLLAPESIAEDFRARTGFDVPAEKLILVPHHLAHLMCGYQIRGGGDAAFFVSDGRGERESAIAGQIVGGEITLFDQMTMDSSNSVGLFYNNITRYLGFLPNNDEYKVMGLSAYCPEPTDRALIDRLVTLHDDGKIEFAVTTDNARGEHPYRDYFDGVFGGDDSIRETFEYRARVARAAQDLTEIATRHQVATLAAAAQLPNLIVEGGVALNCVNNTKLLENNGFDRVDVSYGASDSGLAIGAAAFVGQRYGKVTPQATGTYLGPEYTHEEMIEATKPFTDRISVTEIEPGAVASTTATLLSEKVVIGWFQGAAEYGPRALGARSILANPMFDDIKDIINLRVKHREPFRPFAPMVLESSADKLFEMGKLPTSPYMTFVVPLRQEFVDKIPGACHVDGTSRVQTVNDEQNPLVAELLREVEQATGIACLINTSFNVAGEPIVCSPTDAISCFLGTEIDYLVLGRLLLRKTAN
ncbi:carbamoyltransferase C-terminal domain-containing protein [Nocardia sp. CNY236]|uniref:carbamoyltransferase family protein n=1 Tax=Nocardia sp. CNY236 TaxID=1169152 RepID=UPI000418177C|nr:carbamoyltransferase C-terminal domain-containing protein [Nocardia sp. CNY236]